jgi:glycosyltransferase involved in cell wall biosynthesis
MRVAYVCADPGVPVFGCKGCSIHVQEIVRAFIARGDEVHLFANRLGGPVPPGLESVVIHPLGSFLATQAADREREALEANGTLRVLLEQEQPFDLLYERYSLWSHGGIDFAASSGTPSVLEVNAPLIVEQQKHRGIHHVALAEQIAARCFSQATSIIAVSDAVAQYVQQVIGNAARTTVVPNGVDPSRFAELTPGVGIDASFTVGFVGTLKPWHGVGSLDRSVRTNGGERRAGTVVGRGGRAGRRRVATTC